MSFSSLQAEEASLPIVRNYLSLILVYQFGEFAVAFLVFVTWIIAIMEWILDCGTNNETTLASPEEAQFFSVSGLESQAPVFSFSIGAIDVSDTRNESLQWGSDT